jgi:sRNA-binding carbon storage regulator CsrA
MLVLTRLIGERIVIGESIVIEVVAIDNSQEPCEIGLGIQLPDEVVLTLPEVELGPKGD